MADFPELDTDDALQAAAARFVGADARVAWFHRVDIDDYHELSAAIVDDGELVVLRAWANGDVAPSVSVDKRFGPEIAAPKLSNGTIAQHGIRRASSEDRDEAEFARAADGDIAILWSSDFETDALFVARRARVGEGDAIVAGWVAKGELKPTEKRAGVDLDVPVDQLLEGPAPAFRR